MVAEQASAPGAAYKKGLRPGFRVQRRSRVDGDVVVPLVRNRFVTVLLYGLAILLLTVPVSGQGSEDGEETGLSSVNQPYISPGMDSDIPGLLSLEEVFDLASSPAEEIAATMQGLEEVPKPPEGAADRQESDSLPSSVQLPAGPEEREQPLAEPGPPPGIATEPGVNEAGFMENEDPLPGEETGPAREPAVDSSMAGDGVRPAIGTISAWAKGSTGGIDFSQETTASGLIYDFYFSFDYRGS